MATCQSCRKQAPDNVPFCPHCGAAIPQAAGAAKTVFGYAAPHPQPPAKPAAPPPVQPAARPPVAPPPEQPASAVKPPGAPPPAVGAGPSRTGDPQADAALEAGYGALKAVADGVGAGSALTAAGKVNKNLFLMLILGGFGATVLLSLLGIFVSSLIFLISWLPILVTVLFLSLLLYKAWLVIQDGQTPLAPAKAVGYMLIPLFNLYWVFIAVASWPKEYNAYCERNGKNVPPIDPNLFFAYGIVMCCCCVPFVNFLAVFGLIALMAIIVVKFCDGINAVVDS